MKIQRAGKQTRAYWRAESRNLDRWTKQLSWPEQCAALRGFACGWEAGVRWIKRQRRKP